jgi:ketosteroid isomerase-like protein
MEHQDPGYVAAFMAPWNAHDVDGAMAFFGAAPEWEIPAGTDPWGTRHVGTDAVRRAMADIFRAVPDIRYELVRQHVGSDHLVMELEVTGTRSDGPFRFRAVDIMTFANGKVAAKRSYRKVVTA